MRQSEHNTVSVAMTDAAVRAQFLADVRALGITPSAFGRVVLPVLARLARQRPDVFHSLVPGFQRTEALLAE